MSRFIRWLKGDYIYCAVCLKRTPHLTEVDGWRQCQICGHSEGGDE